MNKARRQIQFSMSSLVLLLTVSCVGVGIWQDWASKIGVLVATEDLDHKSKITETNVEFQRWPRKLVPPGAITSEEGIPTDKYITTRLRKGQAVIRDDVRVRKQLITVSLPPGLKVINIKVPTALSHGLLQPGDRVDVIAVANGEDGESQKIICKDVRVFNIGSSTFGAGTPQSRKSGIVGLLVNEDQATAIAEAKSVGQVRLGLLSDSP